MSHILLTIGTATIAFITTNIDDILLLMLLFSQVNGTFRKRHIVAGHYLGFIVIVAASLLGMLGAFVLPRNIVGLLGIIPILLGLYYLFRKSSDSDDEQAEALTMRVAPAALGGILSAYTASVAAITLANSADNISVYVPLFANQSYPDVALMITVFLILVGVWCYAGYRLVRYPAVSRLLSRYGERLIPYVFIALGAYILLESAAG